MHEIRFDMVMFKFVRKTSVIKRFDFRRRMPVSRNIITGGCNITALVTLVCTVKTLPSVQQ